MWREWLWSDWFIEEKPTTCSIRYSVPTAWLHARQQITQQESLFITRWQNEWNTPRLWFISHTSTNEHLTDGGVVNSEMKHKTCCFFATKQWMIIDLYVDKEGKPGVEPVLEELMIPLNNIKEENKQIYSRGWLMTDHTCRLGPWLSTR